MESIHSAINDYIAEKANPTFDEIAPVINGFCGSDPEKKARAFACLQFLNIYPFLSSLSQILEQL